MTEYTQGTSDYICITIMVFICFIGLMLFIVFIKGEANRL